MNRKNRKTLVFMIVTVLVFGALMLVNASDLVGAESAEFHMTTLVISTNIVLKSDQILPKVSVEAAEANPIFEVFSPKSIIQMD